MQVRGRMSVRVLGTGLRERVGGVQWVNDRVSDYSAIAPRTTCARCLVGALTPSRRRRGCFPTKQRSRTSKKGGESDDEEE